MKIIRLSLILSVIWLFVGCHISIKTKDSTAQATPRVRNVILMIGDGMGLAHQYAGYTANKGVLSLERCHTVGIVKTHAANNYTTDSAASGTAIACGEKTNNGMLGIRPDGARLKSMLEYAADNDMTTGMIVVCELTHATPAAFVAHVKSRSEHENIALDLARSKINVGIGGGRKYFENREDGKNLTDTMKTKGFRVAYTMDEVNAVKNGNLLALLADTGLERYPARGEMLPEAVSTAINILNQNKKGFFFFFEGSYIDGGGHSNNQEYVVNEMLDFDRAIKAAFDFAERDGQTLVVVTADHETGGMSINGGNLETGDLFTKFSTGGHTGIPVIAYSFGPGAELFTGIFDNTEFLPNILDLLGIEK
jgi:alkaline phosphatase